MPFRVPIRQIGILLLSGFLAALVFEAAAETPARAVPAANSMPAQTQIATAHLEQKYGNLPLSFEANRGQTDKSVKFVSRGSGYGLFLTPKEAVLTLRKRSVSATATRPGTGIRPSLHIPEMIANVASSTRTGGQSPASVAEAADVVRMQLVGGNAGARPSGENPLPGTANYFIGNDPARWNTAVPTFGKVRFAAVYSGVDLVYYGNQRQLEYDFVVAPGASPAPIRLHFEGAKSLHLDAQGNLVIAAENGDVAFHKPVVYQTVDGRRRSIAGAFQLLADNGVSFALGRYDRSQPLVIDPTLAYATYLGGNDSDFAVAIALDSSGNTYITGLTNSLNFPLTPGAFETVNKAAAGNDVSTAFVSKLNASGTALVYSTYLGGTAIPNTPLGQGDYGHAIAVDSTGAAYITGLTYSADFPVTKGAYQTTNLAAANSTYTGFICKLNPAGTALVYSTFMGGSDTDDPLSIAVDASGDVYTAGATFSTNYPTTPKAFQLQNNSAANQGFNEFVTKLNPTGTALVYSTYLGGSGETNEAFEGTIYSVIGVAVDKSGDAYVEGYAQSTDFPVTKGVVQAVNNAANNFGFNLTLAKLNPTGTGLLYATYLGGSSNDIGEGLVIDATGDAYITAFSYDADFPVTKGAFQTTNAGFANNYETGVAAKINPAGTALVYATYLGGNSGDEAFAPSVDASGDLYIPGTTASADFPVTKTATQTTLKGSQNGFLTELNPAGTAEVFSTFLGGTGEDAAEASVLGAGGNVYLTGYTTSTNFPVAKGAFETTYTAKQNTSFVADFDLGAAATTKATTTTLTASANPQVVSDSLTFTATVASGTAVPTGSVVFTIDEATVATVALTAGKATYTTTSLAVGPHYVLASYAGNTTYASSGEGLTETIVLPTAVAPAITPAAGTYTSLQTVTLTDATKGAVIYYTTTGVAPTTASTKYTAPFAVSATETVEAIAVATGYNNSAVATAAYKLIGTPSALAAPATTIATPDASLNAIVNTLGLTGTYYFQYGTSSTALTTLTTKTALTAVATPVAATAKLTTLKTKTVYYYQVVVTTAAGTAMGEVLSFTTN
jgi:hypothetical protein